VKNFWFDREKAAVAKEGCWIDTTFENPKRINEDESFEYYYVRLKKETKSGGSSGRGDGKGKLIDDHEAMSESDTKELVKQLNAVLTDEEKQSLKDVLEKNFMKDDGSVGGKMGGNGKGSSWHFAKVGNVKKKKKWETVIKEWAKTKLNIKHRDMEQWARLNRRFSCLPGDLFLPSEMEVEYVGREEDKIRVCFFLDTSGSCWDLKDRFFAAALSLPEDKFDIRLFCFDTVVRETTLVSRRIRGGGGTYFHIIEQHVQSVMSKENEKYPDAVFVVTDGYGDAICPAHPERWYWFMTTSYTSCIVKESHTFKLKDYE